jgi:hypothetical protein
MTCPHGAVIVNPVACRNCDWCMGTRQRKVIGDALYSSEYKNHRANLAMLTLTSARGAEWPALMRRFQSLMKWIRKRGPVHYIAAKEEGKETGMKHLHVIIFGWRYIPWIAISKAWQSRTGAWGIYIKKVKHTAYVGDVIAYVTKYVTKQIGGMLGTLKHVTYSANFPRRKSVDLVVIGTMRQIPDTPQELLELKRTIQRSHARPDVACGCFSEPYQSDSIPMPVWYRAFNPKRGANDLAFDWQLLANEGMN